MSGNLKAALQERLDKNYKAFLDQLQGKSASELIAMAPEITAPSRSMRNCRTPAMRPI